MWLFPQKVWMPAARGLQSEEGSQLHGSRGGMKLGVSKLAKPQEFADF